MDLKPFGDSQNLNLFNKLMTSTSLDLEQEIQDLENQLKSLNEKAREKSVAAGKLSAGSAKMVRSEDVLEIGSPTRIQEIPK